MTAPAVGRIVHYVSYGSQGGRYPKTCRAAVVTEVGDRSDGQIGLCVLNPTGVFFDRQVREDDDHDGGTWHWPCAWVPDVRLGDPNVEQVPAGDAAVVE